MAKENYEHCNELIRVINEHDTITVLQLSSEFKYYMRIRNHNIRENLAIEYNNFSKYCSRWQK